VKALEMQTLMEDMRYGFRMMAKNPGFTAVVILTLALGIGANTAIFSIVNAVLLKSLPVQNPGQLVVVGYSDPQSGQTNQDFSYPMYQAIRDKNSAFTGVLARSGVDLNVSYGGQSELAIGEMVSGNYFATLGVQPWQGRLFTQDDDRTPGGHPIAVLSYGYWQRRFGSDPAIVGKQIILNGKPITVVGVTPSGFYGTELSRSPDIRVPMMMVTVFRPFPANRLQNPRHSWMTVMARRKPGVSATEAQTSLEVTYHQTLEEELAQTSTGVTEYGKKMALGRHIQLRSGDQGFARLRGEMERPLLLLSFVTGIVLLVACANLSNLMLARAEKRKQEIAVRLTIGAGRGRLVRQWLTESILLSVVGGIAGVALAVWAKNALIGFLPANYTANLDLPMDLHVLGFTLVVSLLTGLFFGLAPILQITRSSVSGALREEAPSVASGERLFSLRSGLVFVQVTLSLPLLIGAGLFLHSFQKLQGVNTGFAKEDVFLGRLNPSLNGYSQERIKGFYKDLLERVRVLPGVSAAGVATDSPISGGWDQEGIQVEGYLPRQDESMSVNAAVISPGYFASLGIPVVAGRDFTERDDAGHAKVAIINEKMAHYFFGTQNPIGKKMGTNDDPKAPPDTEIIGVVKDAKYVHLQEAPRRHFYVPMAQEPRLADMTLLTRISSDPTKLTELVRMQVKDLDANLPLYGTTTLEIQVEESLTQERLVTWLSSLFGVLATLLASVGLYGVVAFAVARRTREIGIRMALGAQRGDILGTVLRHMLIVVGTGIVAGVAGAYGAGRLLSSMLFEVNATDLLSYAGACLLLICVAGAAAYLPAQRATLVDPIEALRYE
jgi:predicted permease